MKSSQQARSTSKRENIYRNSKCPCPANQEFARKNDRTPLGDIQDSAKKKQYLSVEQGRSVVRSKSLNVCQDISPLKQSSDKVYAESTRIATAAPFKQPLLKLVTTATVRLTQNTNKQKPSLQPVRSSSSSCRCPGAQNRASATKTNENTKFNHNKVVDICEDSDDDVFRQPTSIKSTAEPKNFQIVSSNPPEITISSSRESTSSQINKYLRGSHHGSQKEASYQSGRVRTAELTKKLIVRSAENLSSGHGHNLKSTLSDKDYVSSRSRLSVASARSQHSSRDFAPCITPNASTLEQKYRSSSTNIILHAQNSASKSSKNSMAPLENKICARSSNEVDQKHFACATLPSQHFVTLSQDTLATTDGSENSNWNKLLPVLSKVKVVRDSSIVTLEEKSFVDGQKFVQDLEQGRCEALKTIPVCSPLSVNVPLRRSNSVSDGESTKRIKTTLRRSTSLKKIVYPLLYSQEYLEDIISYSYIQRYQFLLKPEWIDAYIDKRYRTVIINWLLQVTELISPHFDPVYYMTVRIFDCAIIKSGLRKGHYQLAALVAFWISMKYLDNTVSLKIPKMYALCNGRYSKEQIISMERGMLKSIHFGLNMSDPLDFLHYYLKSSNLENHELLKYGCKFVMECATLFENYSMTKAPLIAASSLYLAHRILVNAKDVYVNFIWFDRKNVKEHADKVLRVNVQYVIMNQYEPLIKYSTPEKLKVAKLFFKAFG